MCCVAEAQAALIVRLSFRFRTKRRSGASSRSIRGRLSLTFAYIYIIYIYFIIYEYFISSVIYAVDFQCFPVQRMVPFVVSQPLCFAQCHHVTGEKWPWRTMLTWRSLSLPRSLPANTLCCSLRLKRLASFRQMEIAGWSKWCWYQGTLWLLDGCMKSVLRSSQLQSSGLAGGDLHRSRNACAPRATNEGDAGRTTEAAEPQKPQKPLIICSCATWKASRQLVQWCQSRCMRCCICPGWHEKSQGKGPLQKERILSRRNVFVECAELC